MVRLPDRKGHHEQAPPSSPALRCGNGAPAQSPSLPPSCACVPGAARGVSRAGTRCSTARCGAAGVDFRATAAATHPPPAPAGTTCVSGAPAAAAAPPARTAAGPRGADGEVKQRGVYDALGGIGQAAQDSKATPYSRPLTHCRLDRTVICGQTGGRPVTE